ncbi:hypothetical protein PAPPERLAPAPP_03410 [Brevundimonas phage vB_BpoS-Papperlapapp]|uniref:Uncharacterized protein n=2 Tax=Marchewkavirus TaxID=3425052 RepID=A0A9E7MP34_9CAUD|nr:hypothetical protein KABACHOK_01770 [Brevundimonas phage vB_BpoS-Kabachok]USN14710.1 hypothetical protein DOMOVOI_02360 [Brevundimonas phage vB_BpoS-Domovoi]USN16082.1 hypothetical protein PAPPERLAPAPP_03410 [Brevundimonas phage vB_BpoS-Papperlapapp]
MRNPFVKQEVRVHLKSGKVLRFFARGVTRTYNTETGALTNLTADDHRGFPFYMRLGDVSAVTLHFVPFWKGLP